MIFLDPGVIPSFQLFLSSIIVIDCIEKWVCFYVQFSNVLAKAKAVELRQKNRDELMAQIEDFKKELSTVRRFTQME